MVTEALLFRLKQLRSRLADLILQKSYAEMSNDRAYSDGTMNGFNRDIGIARGDIANWFRNNTFSVMNTSTQGDDYKLLVRSFDGQHIDLCMTEVRVGLMKRIDITLNADQASELAEYIGGRQVNYLGQHMDSVAAYHSLEARFKIAAEEVGRLRRENRELREQMELV
jgi:hypothetical protein